MSTGEAVSPYDAWATLYDRIYEDPLEGRQAEAAVVAGLCNRLRPNAQSLLDFGSGTGRILAHLAQLTTIETLAGIEQSPKMIEEAKRNLPEATFLQGDIRSANSGGTFDVVTCLFDTINHLPRSEDWEQTFENAAAHLAPGGIFIFDMVTPSFLQHVTVHGGYSWRFQGGSCHFRTRPVAGTPNQYKGCFKIRQDDEAERTAFEIVETTFDPKHVLVSLKKFLHPELAFDHTKVASEILDQEDGIVTTWSDEWPRVTAHTDRVMVVARKQSAAPAD